MRKQIGQIQDQNGDNVENDASLKGDYNDRDDKS